MLLYEDRSYKTRANFASEERLLKISTLDWDVVNKIKNFFWAHNRFVSQPEQGRSP